MNLSWIGFAMLTFALPAMAAQNAEPRTLRPYNIDEMLKLESLGPGAFSPRGDAFVYVLKPPYEELPDYSIPFWAHFFGILMSVPVDGTGHARPLFEATPGALYELLGFSPDGRYLAYFRALEGELRLGLFDRKSGINRLLAEPPDQDSIHELAPVWTGPRTLVFAAADPQVIGPYSPYLQRASGEAFYRAWHKSWKGREPSFTVYTSRSADVENPPFPGSLRMVDAQSGQTSKLADGMFSDLRLSPDGRYLFGLQQFVKSQMPADSLGPPWLHGRTRPVIFDLQTQQRIDVAPGLDVFQGTAEWSPNSPLIGFFAWAEGSSPREGRFFTYDTRSRRLRELPHVGLDLVNEREFGPAGRPLRFVWMGEDIAVPARPNTPADPTPRFTSRGVSGRHMNKDPGRFDWYLLASSSPRNLTRHHAQVSAWAAGMTRSGAYLVLEKQVHRVDRDGRVTPIAPGERVIPRPMRRVGTDTSARDPFGTSALYQSDDSRHPSLLAFDLLKGVVRKIALPKGQAQLIAVDQKTHAIAYRQADPDGSDLKMQLPGGQARTVTRINQFLAGVAKPVSASVSHAGPNGETVSSCLTLPADYRSGHRYPTLVYVYPGSTPDCSAPLDLQRASYTNHTVLASHGYALLFVANPEIATPEGGPLSGIVAATDRALDAAIAAGYVDPDRLALIGESGAGYSGLWIAGHSRRFKALVSINGIANIASHYFTVGLAENFFPNLMPWYGEATRYEGVEQFGLRVTPWQDPGLYWRISPIAHTHNIDVPVLLVGTDMDQGGFSSQYDEMFVALHRLRKDVDYVKYWGEGHGPYSAANIRDLTERTLALFERYLR